MKINKKFDLLVVLIFLGIVVVIALIFNLKPLIFGTFYLLFGSIYLILREKKNFLKIFLAVVVFGFLYGFVFDFVETYNKAWTITRLVFPWKALGILPLDDILGFILMTLFIVVFYEHFLDDEKNRRISKNLKWSLIPIAVGSIPILVAYFVDLNLLRIPYVYLVGGILAIIFPFAFSLYKPRFLEKFLKLAAFFFIVWFVLELVALETGGWVFAGEYIGTVEILGLVFPFEELFFWMFWYAAAVVSYYEFFIDDKK